MLIIFSAEHAVFHIKDERLRSYSPGGQDWTLTFRQGPPYHKLGSAVRYSRAEVLAWLEEQRAEGRLDARKRTTE